MKKIIAIVIAVLIIGASVFYFVGMGDHIKERFGLLEKELPPPIIEDIPKVGDENTETGQPSDATEESEVTETPTIIDELTEGTGLGNEEEPKELPEIPSTPPAQKLLLWQRETGMRVPEAVSSCTIFKDNQYWMYYTGMEGIRLARSVGGLNFQEYGAVVGNGNFGSEQEMVSNPTVFQLKNGKYRMIYEGSQNQQSIRKLYSAISEDGLKWTKEDGVRLADSTIEMKKGTTQEVIFTSVPDVIRLENNCLRMYYTVIDESRIAESCDEGLSWEKKGKIKFDFYPEVVQDPDIILLDGGKYKLFFSTQNFERTKQWILSAESEDGFNFIVDEGTRIEPLPGKKRAVDPDVVKLPEGNYRLYFGESLTFEGDFDILSAISKD